MKQDFEEALSATKTSATQQQADDVFVPSNLSIQHDSHKLIAKLRQEVKDLKEDKENINPNPKITIQGAENSKITTGITVEPTALANPTTAKTAAVLL